ncbi:DUF3597 domain-containing protein [Ramlibacter henchirensis]|uniref:DUF3597 domain-containing protein n=1 Tax=Ramlibacter henchirensis TaxID=204072 RepID=A0A4Z0C1R1_9BURK|nr:DUF3597 domain-containing protein [Ramlibacter henchirensis]TFZ05453.1 DUF3597 domain-containing protein [Ramlibacter henchirensis]
MSILSNLFDRLRNRGKPSASAGAASSSASAGQTAPTQGGATQTTPAPSAQAMPQGQQPATAAQAATAQQPGQPQPAAQPRPAVVALNEVDMEEVLEDLAAKNSQKLNWRTSIVDLMKLLGMDSSLQERKALADELGYTGDKSDSAAMNIWLHKQVMKKVAENGGKVPASLMD